MAEPPITIRAAHDSGPGNGPVTRVVIHATCPDVGYTAASAPGTAHGTALYFATQTAGGSAHYVCGVDGEEHCVPDDVIAWHAPPNPGSLGIEITAEGGDYAKNYSRDQWLSPEVWPAVERAAARCRELCQRHGVPLVRLSSADLLAGKHGICGHVDVSQAWHQSDHSDPGASTFPWDRFMAVVTSDPTPTPAPVLQEDDMAQVFHTVDTKRIYVAEGPVMWWEQNAEAADTYTHVSGGSQEINQRQADVLMSKKNAALARMSDPKALAAATAAAVVAALPKSDGGLTEADVETAAETGLRKVLGSLDNAS